MDGTYMGLISDEKRMYTWAMKEQNNKLTAAIFSKADCSMESYFEKCEKEDILIHEYHFQSFSELKGQLSGMWENEEYMHEMINISTAAAMKYNLASKTDSDQIPIEEIIKGEIEIPEYVYIF